MTPAQLLWFLGTQSPVQKLHFTVDDELEEVSAEITTLFTLLAPTLQHFELRFKAFENPNEVELSNHLLHSIKSLPHLTTLGLGGDFSLGPETYKFATNPDPTYYPVDQLALLPLSELFLHRLNWELFSGGRSVPGDLVSVLRRTEDDARGNFAKLTRLLVRFDSDDVKSIPVDLVKIFRERRIELSLCKMG